ncbi:MAG: hypothetical protein AAGC88_14230 [Bacteroidota bacterium]
MILRLTLIFLLSAISKEMLSQSFPSQRWHEGWMVTSTQDTLKGNIKYDMGADAVQIQVEDVMKTYSSRKMLFFEIFDESVDNYRQFYSLAYAVNYDYKVPILFEVLYEGPLTLLVRESIVEETIPQIQTYAMGSYNTRQRLAYTYYFLDKKGNITLFNGKKGELTPLMGNKITLVRDFIKDNRLKTDRMRDLVRITAFYNSL